MFSFKDIFILTLFFVVVAVLVITAKVKLFPPDKDK